MAGLLDGKVALITGAGGGVGRAYALLFAKEDAPEVATDLSTRPEGNGAAEGTHMAGRVADEIRAQGGRATADLGDVSDPGAADAMIARAVSEFGRLDILVNNARIFRERPFATMSREDWNAVLDVHLHASFRLSQLAFRQMVNQGGGGVIVNTTSRTALRGKALQANCGAAKGGAIALTQTIAIEGAVHGIRSVCISPRGVTRGWENAVSVSAGMLTDAVRGKFSLRGPALAVLWLVSDLAKDITARTFSASDESISEFRWEQAPAFTPGAQSTPMDIAAAVTEGKMIFPGGFDVNRFQ